MSPGAHTWPCPSVGAPAVPAMPPFSTPPFASRLLSTCSNSKSAAHADVHPAKEMPVFSFGQQPFPGRSSLFTLPCWGQGRAWQWTCPDKGHSEMSPSGQGCRETARAVLEKEQETMTIDQSLQPFLGEFGCFLGPVLIFPGLTSSSSRICSAGSNCYLKPGPDQAFGHLWRACKLTRHQNRAF